MPRIYWTVSRRGILRSSLGQHFLLSEVPTSPLPCCEPEERKKKGGAQARRLLEMLNTPMALLAVATVVVGVNSFLFFGLYLPKTISTTPPSSPPA